MNIIGNIKTATKFYIIDSKGDIRWVPNLETAKNYVSNPNYIEWYNKDIYATNERIVKDKQGRIKLASEVENPIPDIKTVKNAFKDFIQQTENYINIKLQEYAKKYNYDSILSMVSYKNSTVDTYKTDAEKAIQYRDEIWTYHYTFINELKAKIDNNTITTVDFTVHYENYLKNFPKEIKEGD